MEQANEKRCRPRFLEDRQATCIAGKVLFNADIEINMQSFNKRCSA
jgi:hypothetical protein